MSELEWDGKGARCTEVERKGGRDDRKWHKGEEGIGVWGRKIDGGFPE